MRRSRSVDFGLTIVDLQVPLEERTIGGLGIHLLKSMAKEVSYRRAAGRNHLSVRV